MEDKGPIRALDVPLGRGVNAEMGEVLFQDGESRGRGRRRGDLVVFFAAVLDGHLEPFGHRIERTRCRVQPGVRVAGPMMETT